MAHTAELVSTTLPPIPILRQQMAVEKGVHKSRWWYCSYRDQAAWHIWLTKRFMNAALRLDTESSLMKADLKSKSDLNPRRLEPSQAEATRTLAPMALWSPLDGLPMRTVFSRAVTICPLLPLLPTMSSSFWLIWRQLALCNFGLSLIDAYCSYVPFKLIMRLEIPSLIVHLASSLWKLRFLIQK